ncbi:hypothetical protein AMEX_G12574 [Astyanax mexicanus]|uniref:Uncharacterized protein n=1 Tax=Astyanax mexicanus TaxID=7994 RepID=A0A8T2LP72_ASTMX|nr:hypothetical protein AMEX_G12574 [Astyanax mexicanus]
MAAPPLKHEQGRKRAGKPCLCMYSKTETGYGYRRNRAISLEIFILTVAAEFPSYAAVQLQLPAFRR